MSQAEHDNLLGRIAVHYKVITPDQLAHATEVQTRRGKKLAQVLLELRLCTQEQMQKLLQVQEQHLAKKRAESGLAGQPAPQSETHLPAPAQPHGASHSQPGGAASAGAARPRPSRSDPRGAPPEPPPPAPPPPRATGLQIDPRSAARNLRPIANELRLNRFLRQGVQVGASDVHIHSGAPLKMRISGRMQDLEEEKLSGEEVEAMLREALPADVVAALDAQGEVDFAYTLATGGRFRANVYRQQRGMDCAFRLVPATPPTLADLRMPQVLAKLTSHHQGLVLLTGPGGCGKSATLAALLDIVNAERSDHILTIEDPIECVHPSKKAVVNQRQVGRHTGSFARALRAALREDPDVIAIGELRDLETIALALSAAETGHLVIATLHTGGAIRTIDRMVGVFPPSQQSQIRTMLSESLRGIVSQRLVPTADGNGRVPALEILLASRAVSNLIRENKAFQIRDVLVTGKQQGMCLLDDSLFELVRSGVVKREDAARFSEDPKRFGA